jgi:hypothetical protein
MCINPQSHYDISFDKILEHPGRLTETRKTSPNPTSLIAEEEGLLP